MRGFFKSRIKWIFIVLFILVLAFCLSYKFIFNDLDNKDNLQNSSQIEDKLKDNTEVDIDESKKDIESEEQKVDENKGEESIDVENKNTTINNTPKTNNKVSSSNDSKVDNSNNVSNNSVKEEIKQETNTNSNNTQLPQKEVENTKPNEDLTKVANPNDFFYSITGGNVEYSTIEGCLKAGEDIAFIDVVDVQYYRCYEVMSKANTIMGYYLNIFCENGNCNNRYKSMIDISSYD